MKTREEAQKEVEEMKTEAVRHAKIWEDFHARGGWGAGVKLRRSEDSQLSLLAGIMFGAILGILIGISL